VSAIIRSWARRKATSESTARFFAAWLKSYGLTEERFAEYRGNPVENLKPLARAGVPLFRSTIRYPIAAAASASSASRRW